MVVKELMSANICFTKPDASVFDAAALMKKYDIGFVPVCDNNGALLGLLTDRDILLKTLRDEKGPDITLSVSDIMTKEVCTVSSDTDIHDAACIFGEKKIRRLAVVENSRLVGVLSLSDLAKKKIFLAEVGDIMGSLAK